MAQLYMMRLALIGSLSVIVIAALWTHIRNIFRWPKQKFQHLLVIFGSNSYYEESSRNSACQITRKSNDDHPRLSGRSRRRELNTKESFITSNHRPLGGYGQSPLANNFLGHSEQDDRAGLSQQRAQLTKTTQSSQPSTVSLTLFSAVIIALITYTLLKMLTSKLNSKFGANEETRNISKKNSKDRRQFGYSNGLNSRKSRKGRSNKDEIIKQLVIQHGSKNISQAMKFLINELEKQKQLLLRENDDDYANANYDRQVICTCSCHPDRQDSDNILFQSN